MCTGEERHGSGTLTTRHLMLELTQPPAESCAMREEVGDDF